MSIWLGGLFCMFAGMMLLMNASEKLPPIKVANRWTGAGIGCASTAVLQSSSAVSCSVCALVQSGKLTTTAAYALLAGSNVGTCATPLMTALGLKTGDGGLLFALVGLLALLLQSKLPRVGVPTAGFCLLMWGMMVMTSQPEVFAAAAQNPFWKGMLSHPLGAWLMGLAVTALLQSSSLTVGLLQLYVMSAPMTMGIALPFLLGQNIGTTATALLATLSANKEAKGCAWYHLRFNLLGNAWALPLALLLAGRLTAEASPMFLALAHLTFNVITAFLHLWWDPWLKSAKK